MGFVNLCLIITYLGFWGLALYQDLLWRADFTAYYTGGALVRDGLSDQLYNLKLQARYQQEILEGRSFKDGLLPFNSPPHLALIMLPLTFLPLSSAFWVWSFIQLGLLAWSICLLLRLTKSWELYERWMWVGILMAFPPLMRTLLQGTSTLLMFVCLLQIYLAFKDHVPGRAGFWLVIGTVRPQVLFPIGLFVLLQRHWRALLRALLLGLGMIITTALFLGWQSWVEFFEVVMKSSELFNAFGIYPETMYNLKGTLSLWLGASYATWINRISLGGFVLYVLVMIGFWRSPLKSDNVLFELYLAVGLVLGIFFNLHVNPHDGLILFIPMVLFYEFLRRDERPRYTFFMFAAFSPLLIFLSDFVVDGALGIRIPVLVMIVLGLWMGKTYLETRVRHPAQV
jgi:hypothetical protein